MGMLVSAITSALVTGAGLSAGLTWRQAVAVFCTAFLTHGATYLKVPGSGDVANTPPPAAPVNK